MKQINLNQMNNGDDILSNENYTKFISSWHYFWTLQGQVEPKLNLNPLHTAVE